MNLIVTHPLAAVVLAMLWVMVACMLPLFRERWRPLTLAGLVLFGVPVLGWLTYLAGPACGVLFLSLGLSLLAWPPVEHLRRRRHISAERGSH